MLRACVQRFDVTENLKKFYKILGTKQALCSLTKSEFPNISLKVLLLKFQSFTLSKVLDIIITYVRPSSVDFL